MSRSGSKLCVVLESQLVGFDGQLRSQQQTTLGGVDLDGPVDVLAILIDLLC